MQLTAVADGDDDDAVVADATAAVNDTDNEGGWVTFIVTHESPVAVAYVELQSVKRGC